MFARVPMRLCVRVRALLLAGVGDVRARRDDRVGAFVGARRCTGGCVRLRARRIYILSRLP